MKIVIQTSYINFVCRKCEGNIAEAAEQREKLCDQVEMARELTFLGDRLSTS